MKVAGTINQAPSRNWDIQNAFTTMKIIGKLVLILFLLGTGVIYAQNIEPELIENDTLPHYPDDQKPVIPTDVGPDLDASFPKAGSLLGTIIPGKYFDWKVDLYKRTGLKLGFSYQAMFMGVPQSQTVTETSTNTGLGGFLLIEAQWHFNRGKDYEGGITATLDWRHALGSNNIMPGTLFPHVGSGTGVDATFLPWDAYASILFWEQHLKKGRFWFRIGQTAPVAMMDFFRYKDSRVSFTGTSHTLPVAVIPYAPPSLGIGFNWHPIEGSELYVKGVINDLNVEAGEFDWSGLFEYGEIFTALEIGKHWRRGPSDFDHAHIMFFYADKKSSAGVVVQDQFIPLPTSSGWGFKVHGTKQWNKLVGFANYTYNTAEGGGFGVFTGIQHSVSAGLVYNQPLDIQGELGLGLNLSSPLKDRGNSINNPQNISEILLTHVWTVARDVPQFSTEIYWRILVLKQLWITPGMQLFVNPTYNIRTDFLFAPSIKARVFF